MNPKVWSELPEELVDRVLAPLPVPILLRLLLVCKRWKDISCSRNFRDTCERVVPVDKSYFLVFDNFSRVAKWFAAYDYARNIWHAIPLPSFTVLKTCVVAAHGGLALNVGFVESTEEEEAATKGCFTLSVFNPMTGLCRELPSMVHPQNWFLYAASKCICLNLNERSKAYTIFVATECKATNKYIFEIYDSITNCWKEIGGMVPTHSGELVSTVTCNSVVYCLSISSELRSAHDSDPLKLEESEEFSNVIETKLLTYDLEKCAWAKLELQALESPLVGDSDSRVASSLFVHSKLLLCGTRLIMVGPLGEYRPEAQVLQGVWIWQLDFSRKAWKEVTRMAPDLFDQFISAYDNVHPKRSIDGVNNVDFIQCVGHGDLIFFSSCQLWHLVYNLAKGEWLRTPFCPILTAMHPLFHRTYSSGLVFGAPVERMRNSSVVSNRVE